MASVQGKGKASDQGKGGSLWERRTEMWPGGRSTFTTGKMLPPACGFPWIAIHGKDSVCTVSSSRFKQKDDLRNILIEVLTNVMVDPLSRQLLLSLSYKRSSKTLSAAVVSAACNMLEEESDNEALCAHLREQVAVNFLSNELKKYPACTYEEAIRTAISALCYMLPAGLKASEIEVISIKDCVLPLPPPLIEVEDYLKDIGSAMPLPLPLPEAEIERVLASICRDTPKFKVWRKPKVEVYNELLDYFDDVTGEWKGPPIHRNTVESRVNGGNVDYEEATAKPWRGNGEMTVSKNAELLSGDEDYDV